MLIEGRRNSSNRSGGMKIGDRETGRGIDQGPDHPGTEREDIVLDQERGVIVPEADHVIGDVAGVAGLETETETETGVIGGGGEGVNVHCIGGYVYIYVCVCVSVNGPVHLIVMITLRERI